MRHFYVLLFTLSLLSPALATAKGPPEKSAICHVGEETVLDEDGNETTVVVYEAKNLPRPAVCAHLRHDDLLIVEVDDEGNLSACESLADGADEDEQASLIIAAAASEAFLEDNCQKGRRGGNAGARAANGAAGTNNDNLKTPADVIHPNIHQNNGPGNAACPQTANNADHCGNMHGIANNPGQSGDHPNDDGVNGRVNNLNNMHGGIGTRNPQVGRQ